MIGVANRSLSQRLEMDDRTITCLSDDTCCPRCQGLMQKVHCSDLDDDTGQYGFWALGCVQCGEVIDPIILRNRVASTRTTYTSRARLG